MSFPQAISLFGFLDNGEKYFKIFINFIVSRDVSFRKSQKPASKIIKGAVYKSCKGFFIRILIPFSRCDAPSRFCKRFPYCDL